MGKGIELARAANQEDLHADALDDFKDQLLIVLMKRLADKHGCVVIPVAETDDTGGDLLAFSVQEAGTPRAAFHFQLGKKQ
jgi:hypothetical protein